ncbi:hypothetical protein AWB61_02980 [Chromobacterium sp. F49]|nr:hypothetical protein Cv017_01430 [Chromobacterium subtsugae]KZE84959.1 hypothetical protein AWB61_02980 [Chromobacterium sp. F49]
MLLSVVADGFVCFELTYGIEVKFLPLNNGCAFEDKFKFICHIEIFFALCCDLEYTLCGIYIGGNVFS